MSETTDVVVVFAKPAVPGTVKTRLLPALTPEQAAGLHLAALADVIATARRAAGTVRLLIAGGQDSVADFRERYPDVDVERQRGADLGARLRQAFDDAFRDGADRVSVVGSDHPSLRPAMLRETLDRLESADAVVGPCDDGGYYAIAISKESWPAAAALLDSIPWSTDRVLAATLERAAREGLRVQLAPTWYDVDTPADLERLRRDAAPGSASARYLRTLGESTGRS